MAEGARRFITTTVEVEGRTEERVVEVPAFEPEPWTDAAELTHVGARAIRVDLAAKAAGRAPYTTDVRRPNQAYAAMVRAPSSRRATVTISSSVRARSIAQAAAGRAAMNPSSQARKPSALRAAAA